MKASAVSGIRWISPPQKLDVAHTGLAVDRSRSEEQQALEDRVVQRVKQRRGQPKLGQSRRPRSRPSRETPIP